MALSRLMWFGTKDFSRWIKTHSPGSDYSMAGYSERLDYLNGGVGMRGSINGHAERTITWNRMTAAEARQVTDFAYGTYGDGPIYFLDPVSMEQNALNKAWSAPAITGKDAVPLIGDERPELVPNGDQSYGYPTQMAKYTIPSGANGRSFYVPVPPGCTAWVGAHGDTSSSGGVKVQPTVRGVPVGSSSVVAVAGVDTPQRVTDSFPGGDQTGIEVSLSGGLAEVLGANLNPFESTPAPGVTASVGPSAPSWAGTAVGALWNDMGKFTYHAGTPAEVAPGHALDWGCSVKTTGGGNLAPIVFSNRITATKFAVMVTAWASSDISVWVDRKPVRTSLDPFITPGDGYQFVIVEGLSAGAHQVDVMVGSGSSFLQVLVPAGGSIAAGEAPAFRLGLVGDSYTDTGLRPAYGGLVRELFRLTGWTIVHLGQGSTGYTNNGASSGDATKSVYGSPSRIAALVAAAVHAVLVVGSVNDGAATPAALSAAVIDYTAKVKAALGPVPLIVAGVEPLNLYGNDPTTWDILNAAVLAAARTASNVVGVIDWRGESWLTGTGSVSAPRGDGNQDIYIGSADGVDTIHPNLEGQKYLAGRFVQAFKAPAVTTIAGLIVQVLPTGVTPETGPFISGQGQAGMQFEGRVQATPYSLAHDSFGLSVKLVETEV